MAGAEYLFSRSQLPSHANTFCYRPCYNSASLIHWSHLCSPYTKVENWHTAGIRERWLNERIKSNGIYVVMHGLQSAFTYVTHPPEGMNEWGPEEAVSAKPGWRKPILGATRPSSHHKQSIELIETGFGKT